MQLKLPSNKMITDCPTLLNSTYYMLQRLLEQKASIQDKLFVKEYFSEKLFLRCMLNKGRAYCIIFILMINSLLASQLISNLVIEANNSLV